MIREFIGVASVVVALGCVSKTNDPRSTTQSGPQGDPWASCATAGPVAYGEQPAVCTTPACRQCAGVLAQAWQNRDQPAWQGRFASRFMQSPVGAREMAVAQAHPESDFVFQHCTGAMAPGANCAAYSEACGTVIADALVISAENTTRLEAARTAFRGACPAARSATIRALQHCDAIAANAPCTDATCIACIDRHMQAIHAIETSIQATAMPAAFDDLASHTPPTVMVGLLARFPANEPPGGITRTVAASAVHSYCFQTREDLASVPARCLVEWGEVLGHPDDPEHAAAWTRLNAAGPHARHALLMTAFSARDSNGALQPYVIDHLRTLPIEGTREAIVEVMNAMTTTPELYATLRQILVDRGVTGDNLPPAERRTPTPPAPAR